MTLHGEDTVIALTPIWGDEQALTGGTVNASTITGLSGLKYNYYAGGKMIVLDGNQAGKVYNIVSNTQTAITVDRADLNKSGAPVTNSDMVCLWSYKGFSAKTSRWLRVDTTPLPVPKNEIMEIFAQMSGHANTRLSSEVKKKSMTATLEITPQNGAVFPFLFGHSEDTADTEATSPLNTTLSSAVQIGTKSIPVAGSTNASAGDHVKIGSSGEPEVREISSVSGSDLVLDECLRRAHASGTPVVETENATGTLYTHTYRMRYDKLFRMWPFMIKAQYKDSSNPENNLTMYFWCQTSGFTIRNDGEDLKLSWKLIGYYFHKLDGETIGIHDGGDGEADFSDASEDFDTVALVGMTIENDTDGSSATIVKVDETTITGTLSGGTDDDWDDDDVAKLDSDISVTSVTTVPLFWRSSVSINGTSYGKVQSVNVDVSYNPEAKYYHNDDDDKYPSEIVFKRPKTMVRLGVRVQDGRFLDLLRGDTEFDCEVYYYLNSAKTQYIKLDIQDSQVEDVPHDLPAGGPIETTLNLSTEKVVITVVDTEPYW